MELVIQNILPSGTHLVIHASPAEGAARAVSSSLEHCRVVTEEGGANQGYPLTQFMAILINKLMRMSITDLMLVS